ncbi:MAG: hypothetical protein HOP28_14445 [Gemmatimonadales bacterium]|nr:hypothetical protein [Gemmatimonadales bacterium]
MGLDELRARLDSILQRQGVSGDRRAQAAGLHDALVELKVAAAECRDALGRAERELAGERQHLADAERRGELARGISDEETGRIADEFAGKHRERVLLLERKVSVIQDELAYTEREYQALAARYQTARQGGAPSVGGAAAASLDDRELDLLKHRTDREAAEQAAKAQLEFLKKKLGKQ